jgi:hypothetical protein
MGWTSESPSKINDEVHQPNLHKLPQDVYVNRSDEKKKNSKVNHGFKVLKAWSDSESSKGKILAALSLL